MPINDHNPISGSLSKLLKESLKTSEIELIAEKYNVHYNTIVNIRDRRKKAPARAILRDMIEKAIKNQEKEIKRISNLLDDLHKELEKI